MRDFSLPERIIGDIADKNTSIGPYLFFPDGEGEMYAYALLEEHFSKIEKKMEVLGFDTDDIDGIKNALSKTMAKIRDIEMPIRPQLQKVCENALNRLFAIPDETINFSFTLTDKITPTAPFRILPESREHHPKVNFRHFFSTLKADKSIKTYHSIIKRRMVDCLIMGAAMFYSTRFSLYKKEIGALSSELLDLYNTAITLNDFLTFTTKERITDKSACQGGFVLVSLGGKNEKVTIDAQGLSFPLLLQESIKGTMELFASYEFADKEHAACIMKKADFIQAQPWDMRFGYPLWRIIAKGMGDTNMIPYFFKNLCEFDFHSFKDVLGDIFMENDIAEAFFDSERKRIGNIPNYNEFRNNLQAKNVDKSMINDSYFTAAELGTLELDSDSDEDKLIEKRRM